MSETRDAASDLQHWPEDAPARPEAAAPGDDRTYGQIAYETWYVAHDPAGNTQAQARAAWRDHDPGIKDFWQAAGEAVAYDVMARFSPDPPAGGGITAPAVAMAAEGLEQLAGALYDARNAALIKAGVRWDHVPWDELPAELRGGWLAVAQTASDGASIAAQSVTAALAEENIRLLALLGATDVAAAVAPEAAAPPHALAAERTPVDALADDLMATAVNLENEAETASRLDEARLNGEAGVTAAAAIRVRQLARQWAALAEQVADARKSRNEALDRLIALPQGMKDAVRQLDALTAERDRLAGELHHLRHLNHAQGERLGEIHDIVLQGGQDGETVRRQLITLISGPKPPTTCADCGQPVEAHPAGIPATLEAPDGR